MKKKYDNRAAGFTSFEIIAAILVIAIIGAIAIARFTAPSDYTVAAEVEIMKSNIRYAQFRALSDADTSLGVNDATWGIAFSANSYTLQQNGSTATINFPGDDSATHNLPAGITVSASASPLTFDVWGSPGASNITVTVTDGVSPQTVVVTQNTGFIP